MLAGITEPETRLRLALSEIYAYYGRTAGMMARAEQEVPTNPILADLMTPFAQYLTGVRDLLAQGWRAEGERNSLLAPALGHAIAFSSWRSLVREQEINNDQAVELMLALVRCAPHCSE